MIRVGFLKIQDYMKYQDQADIKIYIKEKWKENKIEEQLHFYVNM